MGKASRRKGNEGECEAANRMREFFPNAKRGVGQTQAGNNCADVEGTDWWIEVKRSKRMPNVHAAMAQAETETDGRPPLVLSRQDRGEWIASIKFKDFARLIGK